MMSPFLFLWTNASHMFTFPKWLFWLVFSNFVFRNVYFTFLYRRGRCLRSSWKSETQRYTGETSFGKSQIPKPTAVWFANTTAANEPVPRQTWSAIRMWTHCDIVTYICTFHNYWQCVSHCQLQANKITNNKQKMLTTLSILIYRLASEFGAQWHLIRGSKVWNPLIFPLILEILMLANLTLVHLEQTVVVGGARSLWRTDPEFLNEWQWVCSSTLEFLILW